MSEDLEGLAAHRRAIDATVPLLGAIQSIGEMAYRNAERAGNPLNAYATRVRNMLDALLASLEMPERQALLTSMAGSGPAVLVVIGSERGLCGAFNERLARHVVTLLEPDTLVVCWGTRAARPLRSTGCSVALSAPLPSLGFPLYTDVERMTLDILDLVEQHHATRLEVVHNTQVHGFQYTSRVCRIMPPELPGSTSRGFNFEVKPAADSANLFVHLMTEYALTRLYQAVIESAVSEQLARVAAMRLASDNARKLLENLTAQYNLARQHAVTQSLLEIVTGYRTALADFD